MNQVLCQDFRMKHSLLEIVIEVDKILTNCYDNSDKHLGTETTISIDTLKAIRHELQFLLNPMFPENQIALHSHWAPLDPRLDTTKLYDPYIFAKTGEKIY